MSAFDGATLLRLAREAIEAAFDDRSVSVPEDPWLQAPGAVFVTLRQGPDNALRGCIGSIDARQPLGRAVVTAACGAAFRDSRFAPLTRHELAAIRLDISVLSPLTALPVASEAHARAELDRTRPGVLLRCGRLEGLFLPKVWASIADAGEFLQQLKMKAGLPAAFWSDTVELFVFTCDVCAEPDDAAAGSDGPRTGSAVE